MSTGSAPGVELPRWPFRIARERARLFTLLPPKWPSVSSIAEQNFLHTQERGKQHVSPVQSPWRFELRKAPKEAVDPGFVSFSPFQEACPDLFLSRALPAAGCDSKLSLGSGMQSSELSRQSLAYPCPTEINLARPVRNRGCPGPARFGYCKRVGGQSL